MLLTERHDRHGFVQLFQLVSRASPYPRVAIIAQRESRGWWRDYLPACILTRLLHVHTERFRFTCTATQARPQIGPAQPHVALTGITYIHSTPYTNLTRSTQTTVSPNASANSSCPP